MRVLIIGSGGREHAIAWKVAQSPKLTQLYIAPGNPGTDFLGENVDIKLDDHPALVRFCQENKIDLVIVGPETPLANGLADVLSAAGVKVFGPSKAAAQIEASKSFSKQFMARQGIPTARFAIFTKFEEAVAHLHSIDYPVVIKASGLAAGKGVILPSNRDEAVAALKSMLVEQEFGPAGAEVVIEERVSGPEVSLMAFTDGKTVVPMVSAQDHKRLRDGDEGPNTGGMGAYAPAPIFTPDLLEEAVESVLKPAVSGLRLEGTPFIGVLYAGLILTPDGIQTLEFNCRFGDPETQVVLPLLETDLLEIAEACVDGHLKDVDIRWKNESAVCVVLASEGYPGKLVYGKLTQGSRQKYENGVCFQAGTRQDGNKILTAGGRVFGITAWGATLDMAVKRAYGIVDKIHFDGMQYRKDIAWRALQANARAIEQTVEQKVESPEESLAKPAKLPTGGLISTANEYARQVNAETGSRHQAVHEPVSKLAAGASHKSAYAASGVSIDAGAEAVELMKDAVKATYSPAVLAGIGSFGGLFDASALKQMKSPVLVASTDGVGTKVKMAASAGRYRGVGHDIVNHCIDDILVQGARPLFFLDYFATSKLNPAQTAEVVAGIAEACQEAGIALLGGETAEMPGVYSPGEFDVAGTIVGVLERVKILPRTSELKAGNVLLGLRSSGPHTNGYSLIRKIFASTPLSAVFPELGVPLVDALLAPHRSYLNLLSNALCTDHILGLAHLTGGGFIENIPRILPENLDAEIHLGSWDVPPLWRLIQKMGDITIDEMFRVFNMGIGMVVIVGKDSVAEVQKLIPEQTWKIGKLVPGSRKVTLV